MKPLSFSDGLMLLSALAGTNHYGRHAKERRIPRGEPHFIETRDRTVYHVDAWGTRRRATDEEIAQLRAAAEAGPDQRPCRHVFENRRGEVCGHPEDAPIHEASEGCTADGGRCDYPQIHHEYIAEAI